MAITDKKRHQAVQRALKMNILFKKPTFDDVMNALNMPTNTQAQKDQRKQAFYTALSPPKLNALDDDERDWLWNYLQHCHKDTDAAHPGGWDNVPDVMAATVGW